MAPVTHYLSVINLNCSQTCPALRCVVPSLWRRWSQTFLNNKVRRLGQRSPTNGSRTGTGPYPSLHRRWSGKALRRCPCCEDSSVPHTAEQLCRRPRRNPAFSGCFCGNETREHEGEGKQSRIRNEIKTDAWKLRCMRAAVWVLLHAHI